MPTTRSSTAARKRRAEDVDTGHSTARKRSSYTLSDDGIESEIRKAEDPQRIQFIRRNSSERRPFQSQVAGKQNAVGSVKRAEETSQSLLKFGSAKPALDGEGVGKTVLRDVQRNLGGAKGLRESHSQSSKETVLHSHRPGDAVENVHKFAKEYSQNEGVIPPPQIAQHEDTADEFGQLERGYKTLEEEKKELLDALKYWKSLAESRGEGAGLNKGHGAEYWKVVSQERAVKLAELRGQIESLRAEAEDKQQDSEMANDVWRSFYEDRGTELQDKQTEIEKLNNLVAALKADVTAKETEIAKRDKKAKKDTNRLNLRIEELRYLESSYRGAYVTMYQDYKTAKLDLDKLQLVHDEKLKALEAATSTILQREDEIKKLQTIIDNLDEEAKEAERKMLRVVKEVEGALIAKDEMRDNMLLAEDMMKKAQELLARKN